MTEHRLLGKSVGELMSAEMDDELTEHEQRVLYMHLATCVACRALGSSLAFAQGRLRAGALTSPELARAQQESLARIRRAAPHGYVQTAMRSLVVVAASIAILLLVLVMPRTPAASPAVPERETVAARTTEFPLGSSTLTIEQGRFAARTGQNSGVTSRAEIRLRSAAAVGSAEIRIREPGQAYGILATTRNIAGATLVRLDGALPPLERGEVHVYELLVHIEIDGTSYDSQAIAIEVAGSADGERARLP